MSQPELVQARSPKFGGSAELKSIFVEGSYAHELRIPGAWEFARLDEVIKLEGGSQPPKSEFRYEAGEGLIRLIQIRDYKSDEHKVYIPKALARRFVSPDDVMIGRYGPPIFQILRGLEGAYNVALMKAVPVCDAFSNNYLFRYLSNEDLYNYVNSASDRTAGQSGVNKEHLEKYPVAVPPLAEQQQIAAKLDELLAQVDTLKIRLDTIPKILKRFRQSVLAAAVSGNLTEDWRNEHAVLKWPRIRIEDITSKVGSGATPKGGESAYKTEGIPLIRSMNVVFFGFKRKGIAFIDSAQAHDLRNVEVQFRDVLLNITGASIGRVTIAPQDMEGARVNQHVCIIRPKPELLPEFLCWFFAAPEMQRIIGAENYGVTRQALTKQQILSFEIALPSFEEQIEIVCRVKQLFTYADQIEQRVKDAQTRVNHLTQSILAKAFRGELTAEWRERNPDLISGENSAEALLAKIQAEREYASTKKPRTSSA